MSRLPVRRSVALPHGSRVRVPARGSSSRGPASGSPAPRL